MCEVELFLGGVNLQRCKALLVTVLPIPPAVCQLGTLDVRFFVFCLIVKVQI